MSRYRIPAPVVLAMLAALAGPAAGLAGALLQTAALDADSSRLTLNLALSAPVRPAVFTLDAPRRVVIDLPGTRCASALRLPTAAGLVAAIRGAARARNDYRLVLELRDSPAATPRFAVLQTAAGYQLQISLGEAPAPPLALAPAAVPTVAIQRVVAPAHAPVGLDRDIVVAIDAGHGGEDPGASGPGGTHEKDVTLAIARALAARINARPGMRAVLTRDSDRLIDLRERTERARAANADLFVSIHADAVRNRAITGASVYTLSDRGASSEAARWLADRENAAVMKGGVSLANVNASLASVLVDAAQSQNMGASVEAADEVLAALDRVGAIRKRIVQHAGFMVLKSPDAPSMLIETAYISNPAEERNLANRSYQERLASAIEAGVVAYFQRHPPDGTRYARAPNIALAVEDDSGV
ncbi:MAG TPA: N-acetylmuramoyl-L-alanine amidase [Steroidobacteraceae bacterium]|nr:N-acetylmuramoyl-L-alanine amidase [Steroidobacteraceae bacterium]